MSEAILKLGLTDWIGYAPFHVAEELGFFADRGDIEITFGLESATRHQLFIDRQFECIGTSIPAFCAHVRELRGRIVAVLIEPEPPGSERIVAKASFGSIEDLYEKGARLCYPVGSLEHFCFLHVFKRARVPFPENVVQVASRAGVRATLQAGEADAAVLYEPPITPILKTGAFRVITAAADQSLFRAVLLATEYAIDERAAQLQALVDGYFRAVKFIHDKPEEAMRQLAKRIPIVGSDSIDSIRTQLVGIRFLDLAENRRLFARGVDGVEASLEKGARLWQEALPGYSVFNLSSVVEPHIVGASRE
ncbi:MAG: ABC transporter substrate-binding protein [Acidobacteria bacterium]|nr:ABC transporter substrate-binding protein [Acidobacteriota bacterium]